MCSKIICAYLNTFIHCCSPPLSCWTKTWRIPPVPWNGTQFSPFKSFGRESLRKPFYEDPSLLSVVPLIPSHGEDGGRWASVRGEGARVDVRILKGAALSSSSTWSKQNWTVREMNDVKDKFHADRMFTSTRSQCNRSKQTVSVPAL